MQTYFKQVCYFPVSVEIRDTTPDVLFFIIIYYLSCLGQQIVHNKETTSNIRQKSIKIQQLKLKMRAPHYNST